VGPDPENNSGGYAKYGLEYASKIPTHLQVESRANGNVCPASAKAEISGVDRRSTARSALKDHASCNPIDISAGQRTVSEILIRWSSAFALLTATLSCASLAIVDDMQSFATGARTSEHG